MAHNAERLGMNDWLRLSDQEQLAAVAQYLGAKASGRSIAHGKNKVNRYSLDDIAALRGAQPAFPAGEPPDDRWSREELRAWIDQHDAELAAQPRPKPRLRIDQLTAAELRQVAAATSQEQVDQLLDQFTKEGTQ